MIPYIMARIALAARGRHHVPGSGRFTTTTTADGITHHVPVTTANIVIAIMGANHGR